MCLCFCGSKQVLEGFTNADMESNFDSRKSTSAYLFTFARVEMSWKYKLQNCVDLSTTKERYITATEANKQWL